MRTSSAKMLKVYDIYRRFLKITNVGPGKVIEMFYFLCMLVSVYIWIDLFGYLILPIIYVFYFHKVLIKSHKLHSLLINPLPHHASDAQKLIILASSFVTSDFYGV